MKHFLPHVLCGSGLILLLSWILPVNAQNAASSDELLPLVESIVSQQKLIDDNQAGMEKSLVAIQENLRQARIYISRAGGKPAK